MQAFIVHNCSEALKLACSSVKLQDFLPSFLPSFLLSFSHSACVFCLFLTTRKNDHYDKSKTWFFQTPWSLDGAAEYRRRKRVVILLEMGGFCFSLVICSLSQGVIVEIRTFSIRRWMEFLFVTRRHLDQYLRSRDSRNTNGTRTRHPTEQSEAFCHSIHHQLNFVRGGVFFLYCFTRFRNRFPVREICLHSFFGIARIRKVWMDVKIGFERHANEGEVNFRNSYMSRYSFGWEGKDSSIREDRIRCLEPLWYTSVALNVGNEWLSWLAWLTLGAKVAPTIRVRIERVCFRRHVPNTSKCYVIVVGSTSVL